MEILQKNNSVAIAGNMATDFKFSHEVFGEKFYKTIVATERDSGFVDCIPVLVSERLLDIAECGVGTWLNVLGQYRSFNEIEGEKTKLLLYVFAKTVVAVDDFDEQSNHITLTGYLCKKPTYRKTPSGREISDLLLAVNRSYKKSDYIPCITWGRNALFSSKLDVGTAVKIVGRIQSREYKKVVGEDVFDKVAYEVSVSRIELLESEE